MKHIFTMLVVLSLLVLTPSIVNAFTIDSIGSATFTPQTLTQFTYSSANPFIMGTAAPGSTVTIIINSQTFTTLADSEGDWEYSPVNLSTGSHTVSITGDGITRSFTLTIGSTTTETKGGTATGSATTLPVSGGLGYTMVVLGLGGLLVISGVTLAKRTI